jgi:hypothetical protein
MSPRKPTIDGLDDTDDQDGTLEEEVAAEKDLTLHVKDEDEVALGRSDPDRDEYVEDEPE